MLDRWRIRRLRRIIARHDRRVASMGWSDSPRMVELLQQRRARLVATIERLGG